MPETQVVTDAPRERAAYRLGVNLHVFGHGLFLISYLAQHALQLYQLRHAVNAGLFVVALGAGLLMRVGDRGLAWGWVLLLDLGVLTGYGLVKENWFPFWAADIANLGTALGLWAGARPDVFARVLRLYGKVMVLAVCVSGPLLFLRLEPGSLDQRIGGEGFRFGNVAAFTPTLFLIFFSATEGRWSRIVTYLGLSLQVLFGFFTGSRGTLLMPFTAVALYFLFFRKRSLGMLVQGTATVMLVALGAVLLWSPAALRGSLELVESRFDRDDQLLDRREEADLLWHDELTPVERIVGRGMGGSHEFIFLQEDAASFAYNMVHFGHMHLVLKGGIVLLGAVSLMIFTGALRGLRSHEQRSKAAGLSVIVFALTNVGHTQFLGSILLPLFWLVLGHALSAPARSVSSLVPEAPVAHRKKPEASQTQEMS